MLIKLPLVTLILSLLGATALQIIIPTSSTEGALAVFVVGFLITAAIILIIRGLFSRSAKADEG
ncbi:hypothetical protein KCG44_11145 [Pacificimonas sp. WHA3]|uniref:CTP synthetase n=1 Tax=Pacificimonas pallii TaxID=2827236 RepID=A0ABS6SGF0_9SPHN|nr:hypothetical protein [Pacificimonas pallii]MBV7257340.1 hypothetical protein [Pacificimonas pallii]